MILISTELTELMQFTVDHLKAYNALPLEFESSTGRLYVEDELWEIFEALALHELVT